MPQFDFSQAYVILQDKDADIYDRTTHLIKQAVRTNPKSFSLYDVDPEAFVVCDSGLPEPMPMTIAAWGKYSCFYLESPTVSGPPVYDIKAIHYVAIVGRHNEGILNTAARGGEWSLWIHAAATIVEGADVMAQFDLRRKATAMMAQTIAPRIVCNLMHRLMHRPVEFRISHGGRFHQEANRNYHNVVTISLSKPEIRTDNGGHGGGWKMPEHECRSHPRTYKSGKVVWIKGHKRGDPNVPRKTTYRVVP